MSLIEDGQHGDVRDLLGRALQDLDHRHEFLAAAYVSMAIELLKGRSPPRSRDAGGDDLGGVHAPGTRAEREIPSIAAF